MMEEQERLAQQLRFILEADKLKRVQRRSYLADGSRVENTAEHSWHVALMALVLAEHANEEVNPLRVIQMLLVHDIVEIDAGDTYLYDEAANHDKAEREEQAAARLFGLLPTDQGAALYTLWKEFEARETADAQFANALDRLMPLLHNYHSQGLAWLEHGIRGDQVRERLAVMGDGAAGLWSYAQTLIDAAVAEGWLGR
ncbi:MAG: HD domain-containing protein [Anaerolineae bacterium]|nr:HD domain-containing protein [Anaerolineae bacterium]